MSARKIHKEKTYDRGVLAEKLAAGWLRLKGYKILQERYKTRYGEIDLIIQKENLIVFVEVKARPSIEAGLESITPKMQSRITQAAQYYLSQHDVAQCDLRFDLLVALPKKMGVPQFHHLENAWLS